MNELVKNRILINILTVLLMFLGVNSSHAQFDAMGSNFTMLNPLGGGVGGTNDVQANWDETLNTQSSELNFNMTLGSASNFPFFGSVWAAKNIRVFGPGSYTFDAQCSSATIVVTGCACDDNDNDGDCDNNGSPSLTMTVSAGQLGVHMLFDWSVNSDIHVVNVWDLDATWIDMVPASIDGDLYSGPAGSLPMPDGPNTVWSLVSTDDDGDGVVGVQMAAGPFAGFNANFNLSGTAINIGGGGFTPVARNVSSSSNGGGFMGIWSILFLLVTVFVKKIATTK